VQCYRECMDRVGFGEAEVRYRRLFLSRHGTTRGHSEPCLLRRGINEGAHRRQIPRPRASHSLHGASSSPQCYGEVSNCPSGSKCPSGSLTRCTVLLDLRVLSYPMIAVFSPTAPLHTVLTPAWHSLCITLWAKRRTYSWRQPRQTWKKLKTRGESEASNHYP
jgi:hypothetical protein